MDFEANGTQKHDDTKTVEIFCRGLEIRKRTDCGGSGMSVSPKKVILKFLYR